VPFTPVEKAQAKVQSISFSGDIPEILQRKFQSICLLRFKVPRPLREEVENLIYTPQGRGWMKGKLHERFSIDLKPSIRDLIYLPRQSDIERVAQGTVIQAEYLHTYGDWVVEALITLAHALPIKESPLFLPKYLMEKSFVLRDLNKLGIEARAVERPLLIQKAVVLHKNNPGLNLTAKDVEAYRKAFSIVPVYPQPGSIVYLSRHGDRASARERYYPSEMVSQIMAELGAKIVLTREMSPEEYVALASHAETVVADHGAAIYNLLYWKTQNLIELFSESWWHPCFLSLGNALGLSSHVLINVDNADYNRIRARLISELRLLGGQQRIEEEV